MEGNKRERLRSLPDAEGTPILGYEATGSSQLSSKKGDIIREHTLNTHRRRRLINKDSIDPPRGGLVSV